MTCGPSFPFDERSFRALFAAFASNVNYPTPMVQAYYDAAGYYVANTNYGPLASCGAMPLALNLMTAHLMKMGTQIAEGDDSGITIQASIDKISTTIQSFEFPNQWQYWLASTEYGKQLLALLQVQSVGGFFVPGSIGRAGFSRI